MLIIIQIPMEILLFSKNWQLYSPQLIEAEWRVNIGSGNGLLPDGTKPPMMIFH